MNPTDNKLQLSNRKDARSFVFITKIFLKKFGNVELHALGEATKTAVRVAENLQRSGIMYPKYHLGIVTITKVNSFTHSIEGRKRVKLVVTLELTAEGKKRVEADIPN